MHKDYNSFSWKKFSAKLTIFSYFINKHWGITSDTAMTQCSETLLQLYYENNNFTYSIQQTTEKTKWIVLNLIICSRYAEKEGKKAITSMKSHFKDRKTSCDTWEGMERKVSMGAKDRLAFPGPKNVYVLTVPLVWD